jgi:hypothetical protein
MKNKCLQKIIRVFLSCIISRYIKLIIFFRNQVLLSSNLIKEIKFGFPLIHITKKSFISLIKNLRENQKGLYSLSTKLEKELIAFTNSFFDRPKGIILDGPPEQEKHTPQVLFQNT